MCRKVFLLFLISLSIVSTISAAGLPYVFHFMDEIWTGDDLLNNSLNVSKTSFTIMNRMVGIGVTNPQHTLDVYNPNGVATLGIGSAGDPLWNYAFINLQDLVGNYSWYITHRKAENNFFEIIYRNKSYYNAPFVISPQGNVGIGTINPEEKIHVVSYENKAFHLRIQNKNDGSLADASIHFWNSTDAIFSLGLDRDSWGSQPFLSFHDNDLRFETNTGEVMRITKNGNVGIGIAIPQAKLHVNGDLLVNGSLFASGGFKVSGSFIGNTTPRNESYGGFILEDDSDLGGMFLKNEGADRKDTIIYWGDNWEDSLRFMTSQYFWNGSDQMNLTEVMRITSRGAVSIGTADPKGTLFIKHKGTSVGFGITPVLNHYTDLTHNVYWNNITGNWRSYGGGPGSMIVTLGGKSANSSILFKTSPDATTLQPDDVVNLYDRMIIDKNGKVGIGTTNPQEKLEISGGSVGIRLDRPWLAFLDTDGGWSGGLVWKDSGGNSKFEIFHDVAGEKLNFLVSGLPQSSIVIANSGNVGIGTANPLDALEVSRAWWDNSPTDWGGGIKIRGNAPSISFWDTDHPARNFMIHINQESMNFYQRPASGGWDRMGAFGSDGNLYLYHSLEASGDVCSNQGGRKCLSSVGGSVDWSAITGKPAFAANAVNGRVRIYETGCGGSWASSCDVGANGWPDYADSAPWNGNAQSTLNMNGNGLINVRDIKAQPGQNFDMLYAQTNNFYIKSGASSGALYVGSGGNVPLYVSGRIMAPYDGIQFGEPLYRVYASASTLYFRSHTGGYKWLGPADNIIMQLSDANSLKVYPTQSGSTSICRTGSPGYFAVCSSLRKYKKNISDLSLGLDTIEKLNPVEFTWKTDGKRDLGFIAEEVEAIDPLLIEYNDKGEAEGVKYKQLTSVLTKAIQEQQKQIDELKAIICKNNPREKMCK